MREYHATFLKRGKWWVAWCEEVPGALTQGRTLAAAKLNLKDAIRTMLAPCDLSQLPGAEIHRETLRL